MSTPATTEKPASFNPSVIPPQPQNRSTAVSREAKHISLTLPPVPCFGYDPTPWDKPDALHGLSSDQQGLHNRPVHVTIKDNVKSLQ